MAGVTDWPEEETIFYDMGGDHPYFAWQENIFWDFAWKENDVSNDSFTFWIKGTDKQLKNDEDDILDDNDEIELRFHDEHQFPEDLAAKVIQKAVRKYNKMKPTVNVNSHVSEEVKIYTFKWGKRDTVKDLKNKIDKSIDGGNQCILKHSGKQVDVFRRVDEYARAFPDLTLQLVMKPCLQGGG